MARLQYLDSEGVIADRVRERRGGRLRPLDQVLMHSPAMAAGWNTLLGAVRSETLLSDDVRETVILRIAVLNTARYEWIAHVPLAVEAGLTDAQLVHLEKPVSPSPLTGPQQLAVAYAEALTESCVVPQDLFDRVLAHFGEQQLVELTVTVGAYNMVSRFTNALHVGEHDAADGWPTHRTVPDGEGVPMCAESALDDQEGVR